MTCYHPLKRFEIQEDNDKSIAKVVPGDVEALIYDHGNWHYVKDKQDFINNNEHLDIYTPSKSKLYYTNGILIPCGQCLGCRIDYSKEWAARMMAELQYHETASFVTITYNDEYLPLKEYVLPTGEYGISQTLVKSDFQKFMKRLRKALEPKQIRFYGCGEYGGKSKRPHYHVIIFGEDFKFDRFLHQNNFDGDPLYRSPTLERVWPYGFSTIGDVSWQSCAYVARYVTKKHKGKSADYYKLFNLEPEFCLMSRMPGLGKQYYIDHRDEIYEHGEMFFKTFKGGIKTKPPSYFDRLYDIELPYESEKIKEQRRKFSEDTLSAKLAATDLNLMEMLAVEEREFKDRIKKLEKGLL